MADGDRRRFGIGARLAIGCVAGIAATYAMTAMVRRLGGPGASRSPDAIDLVLGGLGGALLAATDPTLGKRTGALAGGGLWLAREMGWLPRVAIRAAGRHSDTPGAILLAGHLAWGWSAAATIRELASVAEPSRRGS